MVEIALQRNSGTTHNRKNSGQEGLSFEQPPIGIKSESQAAEGQAVHFDSGIIRQKQV